VVPAERRGEALGLFGIAGIVSMAVGPAIGEVLVRRFGFPAFFAIMAGVGVASLVAAARIREPGGWRPPRLEAGLGSLVDGVVSAPRLPMALASSFGLGTGVVFTFLPTYAEALGVARIGVFAVAYSLGALTVRATAGRLIDTMRRRTVLVPTLALQAVAPAILAGLAPMVARTAWPAAPFLAVVGLVAGVAHGFLYPALSALVMDVTPADRRGRVLGVFSAFILAGQAAGAVGFGALAHGLGYPPAFALLAACLFAAAALATRLDR
jgi:MFS family permease